MQRQLYCLIFDLKTKPPASRHLGGEASDCPSVRATAERRLGAAFDPRRPITVQLLADDSHGKQITNLET
jgi:hypothetical protein